MNFLVTGTRNYLVPMTPEQGLALLQAAKEWTKARLADGSMDCSYIFADTQGGFAISNADSHEELMDRLMGYPLWAFFTWEVKALGDSGPQFDRLVAFYQKVASMQG